jgi:1,2-phenylacetyl-CoA epoxidase catalytic subunit
VDTRTEDNAPTEGTSLDSKQFVAGLVDEMRGLFARLGEQETLEAESGGQMEVVALLKLALASELEASELAAHWLPSTPELDAKMTLAHQVGDEMRHYHLISIRLAELGEDLSDFDALADGYSPLFQYQRGLTTTVERIAAGPFASEAVAEVRNQQFITFCERVGDAETAKLYRDIILPEEVHHHHLGREVLEKYATTPELQERAAAAVRNTLAIADELRNLAEKTTGLHALPVS